MNAEQTKADSVNGHFNVVSVCLQYLLFTILWQNVTSDMGQYIGQLTIQCINVLLKIMAVIIDCQLD